MVTEHELKPTPCYCDETCEESYKTDRRSGLFYPAVWIRRPSVYQNLRVTPALHPNWKGERMFATHEDYCDYFRDCRYCGAQTEEEQE